MEMYNKNLYNPRFLTSYKKLHTRYTGFMLQILQNNLEFQIDHCTTSLLEEFQVVLSLNHMEFLQVLQKILELYIILPHQSKLH